MTARNFPGLDDESSERMASDVIRDERDLIGSLAQLRQVNGISLETLAFMLGTAGGHLSRYLKGGGSITLTNYLRIARALGYRCKVMFERIDDGGSPPMNNVAHRVSKSR
ncbi:MAG TPA: helix-turn-helix transcriptional regulator [Bradyrhizobium sp.]|nr:helix-turn-helix transcriptional regulator [Bradyrhizobium sp.]